MHPPVPYRVLLVDDAPVVRAMVGLVLDVEPDFTVVGQAGDVEEMLAMAERTEPDLILLDHQMPGTPGIEALPALRRLLPHARTVIFTGYADPVLRDLALSAGAADVIVKGINLRRLVAQLRGVCMRRYVFS